MNKKKYFLFFTTVAMLIAGVVFSSCKKKKTDDVDEFGDGSEGKPFKVAKVADLKRVGTGEKGPGGTWTHDKCYLQVANIDLNNVSDWTPICESIYAFTGTYNGNGYTISNLTVVGDNDERGLFKSVSGTIANVRLSNVNITGKQHVGGVAAKLLNGGTIHHCSVNSITITSSYGYVGGITGSNASGGTVNNCMVTNGTITNNHVLYGRLGGIVGENSGIIKNCYATVDVSGRVQTGGVAGSTGGNATVQYCYATGKVTSLERQVGGIVGDNYGKLYNCVALNAEAKKTASETTPGDNIGRITGNNAGSSADLRDNHARSSMMLISGTNSIPVSSGTISNVHGASILLDSYNGSNSGTWWGSTSGANFPAAEWDFANNRLPHLKGFDKMTQNPDVK